MENRKGGGIFLATLSKKQFKKGQGLVVGPPTERSIAWWCREGLELSGNPNPTMLQVGSGVTQFVFWNSCGVDLSKSSITNEF